MGNVTSHEVGATATADDGYLEHAIGKHPFCAGLKPKSLRVLVECASIERYPAQQLVFSEDSEANRFYLLNEGQVGLELFVPGSGVVLIQTVHAGEVCGASALFDASRWSFSAQTVVASELIGLRASFLREQAEADAEFGNELMSRLAPVLFHRLRATRQRLLEFFGPV